MQQNQSSNKREKKAAEKRLEAQEEAKEVVGKPPVGLEKKDYPAIKEEVREAVGQPLTVSGLEKKDYPAIKEEVREEDGDVKKLRLRVQDLGNQVTNLGSAVLASSVNNDSLKDKQGEHADVLVKLREGQGRLQDKQGEHEDLLVKLGKDFCTLQNDINALQESQSMLKEGQDIHEESIVELKKGVRKQGENIYRLRRDNDAHRHRLAEHIGNSSAPMYAARLAPSAPNGPLNFTMSRVDICSQNFSPNFNMQPPIPHEIPHRIFNLPDVANYRSNPRLATRPNSPQPNRPQSNNEQSRNSSPNPNMQPSLISHEIPQGSSSLTDVANYSGHPCFVARPNFQKPNIAQNNEQSRNSGYDSEHSQSRYADCDSEHSR